MVLARRLFTVFFVLWIAVESAFILYVSSLREWHDDAAFDNVVVLTGGRNRITSAFRLAETYAPKNIFISGCYEKTTLKDILPEGALQNIKIILAKQAKNTQENAQEIVKWTKQNNISEILLITSDYHILRGVIELKLADNSLKSHPCAVKSAFSWDFVWKCIKESHKIAYIYFRILIEKIRNCV